MGRWTVLVAALVLILHGCSSGVQQVEKPPGPPEIARSAGAAEVLRESDAAAAPAGPPGSEESDGERIPVEEGGEESTLVAKETEKPAEKVVEPEARKEVEKLLEELGEGYIAGVEGPFIVLGNITEQEFRRIMRHTIRACSDRMYKQYFKKKPDYKLKIYLFGDGATYRRTAMRLWGDTDVSYFGYYKPGARTLVMNIATGTGTLVHEMFHALVEPDFPDIPTWFNEGVASLYECCQVRTDRLVGMMNWRFPRLKRAVEADALVPLTELVATSSGEFYGRGSDLHYAEARYFCMYLQEKGLLEKFYKKFRDNYEKDETGKKFLEELLGKKLDKIQKDWLKWVKTLRYHGR